MSYIESIPSLPRTKLEVPIPSQSNIAVTASRIGFSPHTMRHSLLADQHQLSTQQQFHYTAPRSQPREIYFDIGVRFGARLRELRRSANMTQIDMAVAFGIDRSYISDVECGKKGISLATLEVVALGFHTTLSDLLCGL